MHEITINSIMATLDRVSVRGHEDWSRMLGVWQVLENELEKAKKEGKEDANKNEQGK